MLYLCFASFRLVAYHHTHNSLISKGLEPSRPRIMAEATEINFRPGDGKVKVYFSSTRPAKQALQQ